MKDLLAALRDIHTPPPVSWWPPAPGWWLSALLGLLLLWGSVRLLRAWYRRGALRREALARLERIRAEYRQDADARRLVQALSRLLRQVALQRWPRRQVSGLTGKQWLTFLDAELGDRAFHDGPGRALVEAPYRTDAKVDAEALLELVRRWIERVTRGGRRA